MTVDDNIRFATNLRFACNTRPSITAICREIGINRQQFNRYLAGQTRPSPYNRGRIARYFGLKTQDFLLQEKRFQDILDEPSEIAGPDSLLREGFPGNLLELRQYTGYYEVFHKSLSWPGEIVQSCARIEEKGGQITVKTIERIYDRDLEIRQFSKYSGLVAYWRNRLFIVERGVSEQPFLCQTTLMPFGEHQRVYLRGVTTGVSWREENLPYSTRIIWRALGPNPDKRKLLKGCCLFPENSQKLPLPVRRYLNSEGDSPILVAAR
ncbi:MAG: helix-turn-helix domain-containing protein [Alphaproteobacteria bacterium]|jgi:transcriptional regulator with XRE-family HTH domain|nr:helix-turn-helix domain-containing protein [Alphaproteobacteria bacterium]MBU1548636.1 helix-turn-helix domain-containing protein [Alphaproteobacteria bacterium]MBU2334390.1 helix-turn-helix domain-containing protein [Alphaproteobacteria bacterium]MBU2389931.1 helix-turn-helix domain-containing protein [Alphaproteobacteria bacterium]